MKVKGMYNMKVKKLLLTSAITLVTFSGAMTAKNFVFADDSNTIKVETQGKETSINLTVKQAMQEFSSLQEFNDGFHGELTDDQWMVADLSSVGIEDGGKTLGWTISPSREASLQNIILDENGNEMKQIEGASVKDIRQALSERDATQ